MLAQSFLLLAAAAGVLAAPAEVAIRRCSTAPTPVLPKTGGATELPDPASGLKLLHIALGFGIQNYSCAAVDAAPVATGALAMLYDITSLYPGQSRASLSAAAFNSLTSQVLSSQKVPLNFDSTATDRADPSHPGASSTEPWTAETPLRLSNGRSAPFIGHHFFNAAGVPTFALDNGAINLLAKKEAAVPAPTNASAGPDATGAVAWLFLDQNPGSVGASAVYRVLTAGGNSHGCSKASGGDSTSYTATYWFYG